MKNLANIYDWIYSTTYWMAEVQKEAMLWNVDRTGKFGYIAYTVSGSMGVRPVIEIHLTEF